jgi:hypothetical protein
MANEKFNDLIEIMALHEEALSEFYSSAAERFSNIGLWEYLSKEETKHAMWLRSILDNVQDETVHFEVQGLSFRLYTDSISKISAEKSALIDKRRKLSQIFEFAVGIENAMIEKKFLDGFTSPKKGVHATLSKLKNDTEEHRKFLEDAFKEFNKQKDKFLDEKKKVLIEKAAQKTPEVKKSSIPEDKPDIKKLTAQKKRQDEIQAYIEEDDTEWIEQYKKTISQISEDHSRLKEKSQLSECELKIYEEEKEKIAQKIEKEIAVPEERSVAFIVYHYIGLHSEYERLLSNLYRLFEKIFPGDELWAFMAEEERKHECWLKDIMKKMKDGTIIFKKPQYEIEKVVKAIVNISEMIHYCKEFKLSHKEAYEIAFEQESSMLEDRFFGNFSSDAPALEKVFGMLIEDTFEHRNWLKRRMDFYNY